MNLTISISKYILMYSEEKKRYEINIYSLAEKHVPFILSQASVLSQEQFSSHLFPKW